MAHPEFFPNLQIVDLDDNAIHLKWQTIRLMFKPIVKFANLLE
jgi:hypothetical protein